MVLATVRSLSQRSISIITVVYRNIRIGMPLLRLILLVFCVLLTVSRVSAQYVLRFVEDRHEAQKFSGKKLSDGKALLVFRSSQKLTFEGSWDNIGDVPQINGLYSFEVSPGSQTISVFFDRTPTDLELVKGSGAPQQGEVLFYHVFVIPEMTASDITFNEERKGNKIIPIGAAVSDAMLLIRVFPEELELEIKEENGLISKIDRERTQIKVYLSMPKGNDFGGYQVIFNAPDVEGTQVSLPRLNPKQVKFYNLRVPIINVPVATSTVEVPKPERFKDVMGYWQGSLGDDMTSLEFTAFDMSSGSVEGKIYVDGVYVKLVGNARFGLNDSFQASLRTESDLVINLPRANIDFTYRSGTLNGFWTDDNGDSRHFSAIRSSTIQEDRTEEVRRLIADMNKRITGTWVPVASMQQVEQIPILFDQMVFGDADMKKRAMVVIAKDGNVVWDGSAKVIQKGGNMSLIAQDVRLQGVSAASTLSVVFKESQVNCTLVSDDGSVAQTWVLRRMVVSDSKSEHRVSKAYYVNVEKAFVHTRPDAQSRTNRYFGQGKIVRTLSQHREDSPAFIKVLLVRDGIIGEGFIRKEDVGYFNLSNLNQTVWKGNLQRGSKVSVSLDDVSWDEKHYLVVRGYRELDGEKRPISGTIVKVQQDDVLIHFTEPGKDAAFIVLKVSFAKSGVASGMMYTRSVGGQASERLTLKRNL